MLRVGALRDTWAGADGAVSADAVAAAGAGEIVTTLAWDRDGRTEVWLTTALVGVLTVGADTGAVAATAATARVAAATVRPATDAPGRGGNGGSGGSAVRLTGGATVTVNAAVTGRFAGGVA